METLRKLEKSGKSIPAWVCETHLREIDDLESSGEHTEAKELLEEGKSIWRNWCQDCKNA